MAFLAAQRTAAGASGWFLDHGGLTRANAQRFRDMILSRGDSEDYAPMFRAFYGKDPDVGPLLQFQGLTTAGTSP